VTRLVIFLLASYGLTNIVTMSRLLRGLRGWVARRSEMAGHWIACPMCVGVPVGIGWSLAGLRIAGDLGVIGEAAVAGAVSSGWCWMSRVVLHRLGEDSL